MSKMPEPPRAYSDFVARYPKLGEAWDRIAEAGSDGPLEVPDPRAARFDNLGRFAILAAILVIVAYAWPIWSHLRMPRFGSPGFTPF